MADMRSHELDEEPDPNETAERFGVDPARERAGGHPEQAEQTPGPDAREECGTDEGGLTEDELVDEAGRESFPASDPPAF